MKHRCPQCKKTVEYDVSCKWRPFCSERCRLIDLGEWIEGKNCIPGDEYQDMETGNPAHTKH